MKNKTIWLINKDNRTALGRLDYLPQIGERLMHGSMCELEYEVRMVLHYPGQNAICVFVEPVQSDCNQILHSVNWNL